MLCFVVYITLQVTMELQQQAIKPRDQVTMTNQISLSDKSAIVSTWLRTNFVLH